MKESNLHIWFLELLYNGINKNRDYITNVNQSFDKIIAWIVGLSVTGFALSIGYYDKLNAFLNNSPTYIIISTALTLMFGILNRIALHYVQLLDIHYWLSLESYYYTYKNPPNSCQTRSLSVDASVSDIVEFLLRDFDISLTDDELSELNNKTEDEKTIFLRGYYLKWKEYLEAQEKREMNELKQGLHNTLGFSKKRIERIFSNNKKNRKAKLYWIMIKVSSLLFVLTCLSFASGFISVLVLYLKRYVFT